MRVAGCCYSLFFHGLMLLLGPKHGGAVMEAYERMVFLFFVAAASGS